MAVLDQAQLGGVTYDLQDTKAQAMIAPAFSTSQAYSAGDSVTYNGTLYTFTDDHAAGAWIGTDAATVPGGVAGEVADLKSAIDSIDKVLSIKPEMTADTYIAASGAALLGYGWSCSDYIPVFAGNKVTIKTWMGNDSTRIALYDKNKAFISGSAVANSDGTTPFVYSLTIPTNAYYIRFSCKTQYLDIREFLYTSLITDVIDGIGDIAELQDTTYTKTETDDAIDDALAPLYDSVKTYLTPLATYEGRMGYAVQPSSLYCSEAANMACGIYALTAGITYHLITQTSTGVKTCFATSTSLVSNPGSVHVYVGTFIDDEESDVVGVHEFDLTPSVDCYLYLNKQKDSQSTAVNFAAAVSCYTNQLNACTKSYVDAIAVDHGVYYDGTAYHHFVKNKDNVYVVQKFQQIYGNNLFQLIDIYYGDIVGNAIVKSESIGSIGSDIVGPIGMASTQNGTGGWSGGVHTVTVDDVVCPTAEQKSLTVKVNGKEITSVGLYYGDCVVEAVNWLYFADEVTSQDLSGLSKAVVETRRYTLTDRMNVRVTLNVMRDIYIGSYYGCQIIPIGMTSVILPNAQKQITLSSMTQAYEMTTKESIFMFSGSKANYDVSVEPIGLGEMTHTTKGYGLITNNANRKTYFYLSAADTVPHRYHVSAGDILVWQGCYHYYLH